MLVLSALVFLYSAASLIQLHIVINTLEDEEEQEAFNIRIRNYFIVFIISTIILVASILLAAL